MTAGNSYREAGGIILILFPGFVPLTHHIKQLRIIFPILIEPDAEFSVDLIDMQPISILQIKEGVYQLCSVVNGRNGVGIHMENLGDLPD